MAPTGHEDISHHTVIWQNWSLIQAARLERDDVYQQLAIRLIRCVDTYDPAKGELKKRIYAQLKYELLNCKEVRRLTGLTGAPKEFRKGDRKSTRLNSSHRDYMVRSRMPSSA